MQQNGPYQGVLLYDWITIIAASLCKIYFKVVYGLGDAN